MSVINLVGVVKNIKLKSKKMAFSIENDGHMRTYEIKNPPAQLELKRGDRVELTVNVFDPEAYGIVAQVRDMECFDGQTDDPKFSYTGRKFVDWAFRSYI